MRMIDFVKRFFVWPVVGLIVVAVVEVLAFLLSGGSFDYSDWDSQEDLQVRTSVNAAVILRSSLCVSNGKIYYLDKTNGEWGIRQTIDLKPYLHGLHTIHPTNDDRSQNDLAKRSFAFNDKWLCVVIGRRPMTYSLESRRDHQRRVLIFKRAGDQWEYHHTLASGNELCYFNQVEVVNDQLMVMDRFQKSGQKCGALQCFDLSDSKPRLCQTIYPPFDNGVDPRNAWLEYYVKDDLMLVRWDRPKTEEEKALSSDSFETIEEDAIYQLKNNRWELWQTLSETIPQEVSARRRGTPLSGDIRVDLNKKEICIYCWYPGGVLQFVNRNGKWAFADSVDFDPNASKDAYSDGWFYTDSVEVGLQSPWSYNVVWRDKMQLLGVVKPSDDGKIRVAEPNWFLRDADPVTLQTIRDYYSSGRERERERQDIVDFKLDGYESYYDYASYIPLIDYSICGSTLVTSYTFEKCYLKDNPFHSADVWGGVNIYEIDSETGPKRVFSLKTGHLDELKPVPVGETVLETNVPTLEESQARKKSRLIKNKEEYKKAHPGARKRTFPGVRGVSYPGY